MHWDGLFGFQCTRPQDSGCVVVEESSIFPLEMDSLLALQVTSIIQQLF